MKLPAILTLLAVAAIGLCQGFEPAHYSELKWTNVGPNRGGRSVACTGVRTRPNEYYFGATGGGLWKTTDAGVTWACVTDGFVNSSSVGAVAVSDSNPDIVYIGMGERDIRGNISEGDGVYKSTDAGKTWTHVGLAKTRTVSRILIDPKNPDLVYVAALGPVYGRSPERGIFKSADGGRSWNKVLFESDKAGAVEMVFDPKDSNTLYAATWEAWRTPYHLNSGGPGSKLWKSTNAGATWTDLSRNPGLPKGVLGKIGVSVSGADSKRVYAIVEALDGGIFRSDDAGATWTKTNDDNNWRQRAWYYTHVYADPKNVDRLYVLNVGAGISTDGGKTFSGMRTPHSDNHDLWINPDDPAKMINANDGGGNVSTNTGQSWTRQNFPTAQLYHVVADNAVPYRIYGAQQDNSSIMLMPDQTDTPEKRNFENTAGGESGYIAVKPDDPFIVIGANYSGNMTLLDNKTKLRRDIDPWPLNPMGHGAIDLRHRMQWTFPIIFSPHNSNAIYASSQFLLRTDDFGQSWKQISPDLTRNDPATLKSSGGPITQDNTGVEYYGTIFTISESPLRKGVIWTGSDDGLVHITQNGGRTWTNITPRDLPKWARISIIEASPHDPGTAYFAANNYQSDEDLAPYIYRTRDFGKTWTKIVSGIKPDAFARVVREDPRRKGLLYAGTETGVYVSFNDGDRWQSLQANLPVCPIHDLVIKDDDIVVATHGRSFWIMKDTARLAQLMPEKPSGPLLLQPTPRFKYGNAAMLAIPYYLPAKAEGIQFAIFNAKGEQMGTATGSSEPGFQRTTVNLSHPAFGSFPGMIFWSGFPRPIPAPPGTYTVRMTYGGKTQTKELRLLKDPRVPFTEKDLQEQYEFAVQITKRLNDANGAVLRIRDMKSQIEKAVSDPKADADLKTQGKALTDKLTAVEGEIYQYRSRSGQDPLNYPIKLNDQLAGLLSFVLGGQQKPPQQSRDVYKVLSDALEVQLRTLKGIESREIADLNSKLKAKGIDPVVPKTPPFTQAGGRRGGGEEEGN